MKQTLKSRLVLMITFLVMGTGLVATGLNGYLSARENYIKVTRADTMSLMHELTGELRLAISRDETLEKNIQNMQPVFSTHGAKLIAVCSSVGNCLGVAGPIALDNLTQPHRRRGGEMHVEVLNTSGLARVTLLLPKQGGRTLLDAFDEDLPSEELGAIAKRLRSRKDRARPRGFLVLEVVSPQGASIVSDALFALVLEIGVALVLLGLSLVFWRISVNAERAEAQSARQLERDRQLKMLGQMSAVLGHELRNPITSLKGNAQLLLEKINPESEMHKRMARVVEEAELLETLTNQVLDFAKSGEIDPQNVNVGEMIEEVLDMDDYGEVEVRVEPEKLEFVLDRGRIAQCIDNLLRNARQAAPKIPIQLQVNLEGQTLVFRVSDKGVGISQDQLEQVFEPFFTTRVEGVGLGLALVRRLVEAHGGSVSAWNNKHGGATFEFRIPPPKEGGTPPKKGGSNYG